MAFRYPSIDMIATGQNITNLMHKNGITVVELMDDLGFANPQSIYKWKRGECLPTIDNLIALACLFDTTVDEILIIND